MSLVVYVALIAAAVIALRHGPGRALLVVWLPAMLLIPDGFRAITPGLPDPNFSQAAMIPIVAVAALRHLPGWRPTGIDLMVLAFAVLVGVSDFVSRGYSDAQNLMFGMLFAVVAPYLVARWVIPAEDLHVAVARRLVILVFAVVLIGLYEFRFAYNPFHAHLGRLFPGQGDAWVTTFRHGLPRVAGPYSHAILAGIVVVLAYRLQRWLEWNGHWERRFARVPLPKARTITVVLFAGALMTIARGPLLGGIVAGALAMVGLSRDRSRNLRIALALVAAGAVAGFFALQQYLDIAPGAPMTMSQESALYRKVLFEKYLDIAVERAWLGWGLTTWPKVRGMESIDNYFLLLSLMHGVVAAALLALLLVVSTAQQLRLGLRAAAGVAPIGFTFAGIFVAVLISLGTVYLGEQAVPLLFFLLGWAQGLHATGNAVPGGTPGTRPPVPAAAAAPSFRGVIC